MATPAAVVWAAAALLNEQAERARSDARAERPQGAPDPD